MKSVTSSDSPGGTLGSIRTVREAAEYLRVPPSWVYTHLGQLPHIRLGKYVRFRLADLEQAITANMRTPTQ